MKWEDKKGFKSSYNLAVPRLRIANISAKTASNSNETFSFCLIAAYQA
jgi:hypothetical protein